MREYEEWCEMASVLCEVGMYEKALLCYKETLKINPCHPWVPINKGNALLELGRYEEAIVCYDEGSKADTVHLYLWVCKGIALKRLKRYQDAITCYDNALKLKPDHERAIEERQKALAMLNSKKTETVG